MRITCSSCDNVVNVPDHLAGKKVRCPECQRPIAVTAAKTGLGRPQAPARKTNLGRDDNRRTMLSRDSSEERIMDRRGAAPTPENTEPDLISNGADDDGSGSTGLLGIAKAFATGPKPKRSVVFVWHAGEERGREAHISAEPVDHQAADPAHGQELDRAADDEGDLQDDRQLRQGVPPERRLDAGGDDEEIGRDRHRHAGLFEQHDDEERDQAGAGQQAPDGRRVGARVHALSVPADGPCGTVVKRPEL